MNKKSISLIASIGLLITAAIWGFSFVVVKDSLNLIGPTWMIAFRYTIAAFAMSLIFIKKWKLLNPKTILRGIITGLFLFTAYLTQTIGCNYTTAGRNAFLTTIYVILVPLIGWILYKKRPSWYVFAAAFLSIFGIGLIALGNNDATGLNAGDFLTLACGVFFALHIAFSALYISKGEDTFLLTLLQFITTAILGWFFAPILDGTFPVQPFINGNTFRIVLSMLYLGLFSTMIGFTMQNLGVKYVQPSLATLFLSFESVFGVLFSVIFLHDQLTWRMILGCLLMFISIILAETKFDFLKRKTQKQEIASENNS